MDIYHLAVSDSILKTTFGQLAFIAGTVPYLREEGMPRGADCFMEDVRSSPSVTVLHEVGTLPRYGV